MRSYLRHEKGISLIMTIIMLVVVFILVTAFMRASIFNINFSQNELDQKRAFYAAEAGVEHLLSMGGEHVYEKYVYDENNGENITIISDESLQNNDELDIMYRVFYNNELQAFEAEGIVESYYGNFQQSIVFDFSLGGPKNLATLLYAYGAENYYRAKKYNIDIEPGTDDSVWESFDIQDLKGDESRDVDMSEIDIWHEDIEYEKNDYVVNILDARGNPKQYGVDNMEMFDFLDVEDDHKFDDEGWTEFFHNFVEMYSKEQLDWPNDEEDEFEGENYYGFNIEDYGNIDKDVSYLYEIFSPIAEIGELDEDYEGKWEDKEYFEDEVVEHEGYYYKVQVESTEDEPGDSDDWERIDSEERFAGVEISNSVIIVDGDLEMSNVTLNNSLLIVKGQIDFRGTQTFNDSLLVGFNEGTEDDAHAISGTPSVNIDEPLDETYKEWPIIREVIDELLEEGEFARIDELINWRVK